MSLIDLQDISGYLENSLNFSIDLEKKCFLEGIIYFIK